MKERSRYRCRKVTAPLCVDGTLEDPAWVDLPWTEDFVDIAGDPTGKPCFRTRARMARDDDYFYVGAEMEEPHVWGTIRLRRVRVTINLGQGHQRGQSEVQ